MREFFFQNLILGYMTKTESDYFFFPPPKSEYFFRKKTITLKDRSVVAVEGGIVR
jgi:hypothetical protein